MSSAVAGFCWRFIGRSRRDKLGESFRSRQCHGIVHRVKVCQEAMPLSRLLSVLSPRRRWRKFLWALFVFAACVLAFMAWAIHYGNRALNEAIAEATRDDPFWQMDQIIERRRKVPDDENSALVILAGMKLHSGWQNSKSFADWQITRDDLREEPQCRANEQQLNAMAQLHKLCSPALVEFGKLKDMPFGRYPTTNAVGLLPYVFDQTNIPQMVEAVRTMQLESLRLVESDDIVGVTDSLIGALNAVRSIGDEPFSYCALIRIECDEFAVSICERLLAQMSADEPNLARIQKAIELELNEPLLSYSMRCDRAYYFSFLEFVKANPSQISSMNVNPKGAVPGSEWLAYLPGTIINSQVEMIKHMNEAVRVIQQPTEKHNDAINELDKARSRHSLIGRHLNIQLGGMCRRSLRQQAQLRCVQVLFAAERYRLRHQSWPEQLDDLVTEKLIASVPIDPYDGLPLRWKITEDGRMVYSVGPGFVDNGGKVNRLKLGEIDTDLGYQLFDVDKRRQPPRPTKPKEPTEDEK